MGDFFIQHAGEILTLTLQHLILVLIATAGATIVSIPLGILLTRKPSLSGPVLSIANIFQTIPSLALFGFLIPLLGSYGIGRVPAIIALFIYSLLPIIRNTFVGITGIDPAIREAGRAMGMTDWQLLTQVELPLALTTIIAGVRLATVISIGTATIAAAIGAGGLGMYIFRGLRMNDNNLILAGAIPAALMALSADFVLGWVEKALTPGAKTATKTALKVALAGVFVVAMVSLPIYLVRSRSESRSGRPITVGSKDFTEQVILSEVIAQLIEANGLQVTRRFELGGDLCHRAMIAGEMDVYVEYTGTAFAAILKHKPISDPQEVLKKVTEEYSSKFDIQWLDKLGFNNTYAILVRGDEARKLQLKTISDAARYAPQWRAGFGQDFMSREDGYPGFSKAYGLRFADQPREMDLALTYRALAGSQVDMIAGNSTDGLITKLDLYQLEDNRKYFPPYDAAPVILKSTLIAHPELERIINTLSGRISEERMRQLNDAVDGEHRSVKEVAREFIATVK